MNVLVISPVIPRNTSGGELVLHRHLSALENDTVTVAATDGTNADEFRLLQLDSDGWLERAIRSRLAPWMLGLREGFAGRVSAHDRDTCRSVGADLVLTVAHGPMAYRAAAIARQLELPLVTIFHDWWPAAVPVHDRLRASLERRFRHLYQTSRVAFCVSERMREELGPHDGAKILYPIPDSLPRSIPPGPVANRFRCGYAGVLDDVYGQMIDDLSALLASSEQVKLDLFGPEPNQARARQLRERGHYHGFVNRTELVGRLATADVLLVAMSFDPKARKRVETSFPSKLTEYVQYGRPLLVWGPADSSAIRWANEYGAAATVTSPQAAAVLDELQRLRSDASRRDRLARRSGEIAAGMFNSGAIHQCFKAGLEDAVESPAV